MISIQKIGKVVEHRLIESKRKNKNQEIFDVVYVNKDGVIGHRYNEISL